MIDVTKFQFFIKEIYEVPKTEWLDLYDDFNMFLMDYEKHKKNSIDNKDVEYLEEEDKRSEEE